LEQVDYAKRLAEAVEILHRRDTRAEKPDGAWTSYVWLPSAAERRSCCEKIKPPDASSGGAKSRLYDHCRSLEHVANLCAVDPLDLRRAFREAGYAVGRTRGGKEPLHRLAAKLRRAPVVSLRDRLGAPLRSVRDDLLTQIALARRQLEALEEAALQGGDLGAPDEALAETVASLHILVLQSRKATEVERLVAEMEEILEGLERSQRRKSA
jgi:hypothetical protein